VLEKLFDSEVNEIKALEQQASQFTHDRDAKAAVAEQISEEVFTLRKRRDELEQTVANASTLLLNNQLTMEDYHEAKKELSSLYQHIDNSDETFNVFDRAVNEDYTKQLAELQSKISKKRSILLSKYSKKIASDIIDHCGLQIRQMLAIFPNQPLTLDDTWKSSELGKALVFALSHDIDGNLKRTDPDEPKQLINSIFKSLGLEQ
jgi:hypothetical protein